MKQFLPISAQEIAERGWEQLDFLFISGDAYVDHPSFGPAVICRVLEAQGYSVLSQDIEEFAHQTFFSVDTHRLPSVLLVPSKGRCLSRSK